MSGAEPRWGTAVGLSLAASFGWSTYYLFILAAGDRIHPAAALAYPFLIGGGAYALWATYQGEGPALRRAFLSPSAWLRTGVMIICQISVLAATYLTGPVDASLLSLLGDVVATPVLVAVWTFGTPPSFARPAFAVGLVLSIVGGMLAIVGGGALQAIPPAGWLVVPALPLAVAFYFVLSARAAEPGAASAVVAQSMLGAGVFGVLLSPLFPGGAAGLGGVGVYPAVLLAANGIVSFFLAPWCYFRAIKLVGFGVPPTLMTGIPVFTLLLSAVFLSLHPALVAVLGIPIAVIGGVVILRSEQSAPRPAPTASR